MCGASCFPFWPMFCHFGSSMSILALFTLGVGKHYFQRQGVLKTHAGYGTQKLRSGQGSPWFQWRKALPQFAGHGGPKGRNGQKGGNVTQGTVGVAPSPRGGGGIFNLFSPAAQNTWKTGTWENLTPEDGGGGTHPPTPLGGEGSGTLKEASW